MKKFLSALVVLALLATLPTLSFGQAAEREQAARAAAELKAVNAVLLAQAEAADLELAVEEAADEKAPPAESGREPAGWKQEAYYRYWMHMAHHDNPAHLGIRTKTHKLIYYYGCNYDGGYRTPPDQLFAS